MTWIEVRLEPEGDGRTRFTHASIAAGTDATEARAAEDRTTAFYTGTDG